MRLLSLSLLFCLPCVAHAQLVESGSLVLRGEPVRVSVATANGVADTLEVIYRPSAALARHVYLPTQGASEIMWTPDAAGVVRLVAGSAQQNVSVRYRAAPAGGVIVLLLAGFILFGGAAYAFRKLFGA